MTIGATRQTETTEPAQSLTVRGHRARGAHIMVVIIGLLIAAAAVLSIFRVRTSAGPNAGHLGSMSEQWLAEHRAAHSP